MRDTTLRPDEVVNCGKRERRDFPPLAAYVADDPNVETGRQPHGTGLLRLGRACARAAKTLGDLLFPAAVAAPTDAAAPAKVVKVGPVRVRM